jgi:hypothetical protein
MPEELAGLDNREEWVRPARSIHTAIYSTGKASHSTRTGSHSITQHSITQHSIT